MAQLIVRRPYRRALAWPAPYRLFNDSFARFVQANRGWTLPANYTNFDSNVLAIDLFEDDDNVVVKADLPGVHPENVDISIEDNTLTIKAEVEHNTENGNEHGDENGSNNHNYYVRERFYGSFHRAVSLPTDVDADATEASYENGTLTVTLPKAETVKPRRIEVKAS
jgi:HSP20 family protein